jgi:preprotein translocase subunit SecE
MNTTNTNNTDMSKFKTYIDETTNELFHKVSWPSWSELQSSAIIVAVASAIIALVVWAMDITFEKAMEAIYHLF